MIVNWHLKNRAFEWAVADFIKKNYDLSNVFRDTKKENWNDLSELSGIMISNIQSEFAGFSSEEMYAIMYYVWKKLTLVTPILLNGSVNDDEIYNLLDMSYEMTK